MIERGRGRSGQGSRESETTATSTLEMPEPLRHIVALSVQQTVLTTAPQEVIHEAVCVCCRPLDQPQSCCCSVEMHPRSISPRTDGPASSRRGPAAATARDSA